MASRDARGHSYWIETAGSTVFPAASDCSVDVAILGGGIAGLVTAYLLQQSGKRVAVLEMDRVAKGNTALTTAHLTWLLDDTVHALRKRHGRDHARLILDAHHAAIAQIESIARTEKIDCDFERVDAYRFGLHARDAKQLRRDVDEAQALGRECDYALPAQVPVRAPGGAVRVPQQAKFHPLKFALELALKIPGAGSHVFEQSRVTDATEVPGGWEVRAGGATIRAGHVVVTTHSPFGLVPQLQTRVEPYQSYALALRVPRGTVAEGLFYDTEDPYHYLRVERGEAHDTWILGGEDHKTGATRETEEAYGALEQYLRSVLGVTDYHVTHRWSGQVLEPVDGVAYIGAYPAPGANRWVATGFSGNGITYGVIAGMLLRDAILGFENSWARAFDPARTKFVASATEFAKANVEVAMHFVGARLATADCQSVDEVPAGEGRIVRVAGRKLAVYKDPRGEVTAMSPVCPHMGCHVEWNTEAKTWDCPCHGSRFGCTGELHTGPATSNLEPATLVPSGTRVPAR